MDEDDTLAGFLEEEEWEALADNILADELAPKCHLFLYILEQKKKIIEEAYLLSASLHTIDCMEMESAAICYTSAYPYPNTVEERAIIKDHKN
jgi:hypothetical protein